MTGCTVGDWCQDDVRLLLFCLFGGREVTLSSKRTVCTESRTVRILICISNHNLFRKLGQFGILCTLLFCVLQALHKPS